MSAPSREQLHRYPAAPVTRRFKALQPVLFAGAERAAGEEFELTWTPPRLERTILDDAADAERRGVLERLVDDEFDAGAEES